MSETSLDTQRSQRQLWAAPAFPAVILALASCVIAISSNPGLVSPAGAVGLATSQIVLLVAVLGQTLILIGRGIDLSVGAGISLVNVCVVTLFGLGWHPAAALLASVVVGMLIGAFNGFLAAYIRINPLLATFATSFILTGLSLALLPAPSGSIDVNLVIWFMGTFMGLPTAVWVLFGVIALWLIISRTAFMLQLYAVGGDPVRAFSCGIPVRRVQMTAYILSGVFTGLAGLFITLSIGAGDPLIGQPYTLLTIAAAIIGGVAIQGGSGDGIGALFGALFIGLISDIVLGIGISPFYEQFVVGVIMLLGLGGVVTLRRYIERTEERRLAALKARP